MKLISKSPNLSITRFDAIEINDFSVITGKNGSGKTHFLNAIKIGCIDIEGIETIEIVYYNYNDFTIYTGTVQNDSPYKEKASSWNSAKNQLIDKIQILKHEALQSKASHKTQTEQFIFNLALQTNFDIDIIFKNQKDLELLHECKNKPDFLNEIVSNQRNFTPEFYHIMFPFLKANGDIEELHYEKLKQNFEKLKESIENTLKEKYKDLFVFLKNMGHKKSILNIDANDFESPNLFLEDIANEEKDYQINNLQNQINQIKARNNDGNVPFLENNKFIEQYGLSPIEQINKVLSEYDCNGYLLYTDENQSFLGVDKKNINIQISLKHKEKGYITSFEQLSSGEKTLIALSLLIYKTKKNKIIPRVLLLDEIDSSLHPSMINRLLDVIQNLFIKEQGFKVIMATHSPTTVALSPDDAIYVINKDDMQIIKKETKADAINILTEGFATVNEEDTNIGISYNIGKSEFPVVLFTEGITDKIILETAWKALENNSLPFYIQDCFCASFLGNIFKKAEDSQDGIFIKNPNKTFIALFDFDDGGYREWNSLKKKYSVIIEENPRNTQTIKHPINSAYIMLLPVPQNTDVMSQVIKSGNETYENQSVLPIELLFYGIESLSQYFKKTKIQGGGEIVTFEGTKKKFANTLSDLDKECFNNFKPLFQKIKDIIKINTHNTR